MSDFNWGSDDSTTFNTTPAKKTKSGSGSGKALTFVIAGLIVFRRLEPRILKEA